MSRAEVDVRARDDLIEVKVAERRLANHRATRRATAERRRRDRPITGGDATHVATTAPTRAGGAPSRGTGLVVVATATVGTSRWCRGRAVVCAVAAADEPPQPRGRVVGRDADRMDRRSTGPPRHDESRANVRERSTHARTVNMVKRLLSRTKTASRSVSRTRSVELVVSISPWSPMPVNVYDLYPPYKFSCSAPFPHKKRARRVMSCRVVSCRVVPRQFCGEKTYWTN